MHSTKAHEVLSQLEQLAGGKRSLSAADQECLSEAGKLLSSKSIKMLVPQSKETKFVDVLSVEDLKRSSSANELLQGLADSLKAMLAAEEYAPKQTVLGSLKVPVHNQAIGSKLKAEYSPEQFDDLFSFCKNNGTFKITVNSKNGLVQTSGGDENWNMSGRQWVTDTVRCGDLQRHNHPAEWRLALLTLVDFYNQAEEVTAIESSIKDPEYYRTGGLMNGIAHIFIPGTLKRDSNWFNNKRLESHGLALKALCDTLVDGLVHKKSHGFSGEMLKANDTEKKLAQTIVNLASYLKAINTGKNGFDFAAPSAGPWEEVPFEGGLTWDTEAMRAAFESLRDLLFNKAYDSNSELSQFRSLVQKANHGQWLADSKTLDELMSSAQAKVMSRLFQGPQPIEHPKRPIDSSTSFISTSTIRLGNSVTEDAENHMKVLKFLEDHIVRDNGMIRYAPFTLPMASGKAESVFDSYLADNYWLIPDLRLSIKSGKNADDASLALFGSADCSTEEDYIARTKVARPNTEAEWCWVSVAAEGYARQALKLMQHVQNEKRPANEAERKLIKHALNKATEFINRSYARITGEKSSKANGKECPSFAVTEAFEHVSPLNAPQTTKAIPGANTPLAWGQSSLYSASLLFAQSLKAAANLLQLN